MTRDVNMLLMLELALGIQQLMDIFGSASELPVILSVDASLYSQQPVRLPASGSSFASLIHPFKSGKAQFLVPLPRLRVLQKAALLPTVAQSPRHIQFSSLTNTP